MGKMISFYGSGDDNFVYDVNGKGGDEIGCYNKPARFTLVSGVDSLQIYGVYAPDVVEGSVWVVGVALSDEDMPLPNWPMYYSVNENGYSVQLNIDCPDDVKIIRSSGE